MEQLLLFFSPYTIFDELLKNRSIYFPSSELASQLGSSSDRHAGATRKPFPYSAQGL